MLIQCLCVLALTQVKGQQMFVVLTQSNTTAGATTSHTFQFYFQNSTIPTTAKITFNYTADFTLTSLTKGSALDYCQSSCTLATASFNVVGTTITLTNLFTTAMSSANLTLAVTFNGVLNPSFVLTDAIYVDCITPTGDILFQTPIVFSTTPRSMSCAVLPSANIVSTLTSYTFATSPSASGGYFLITFPSTWAPLLGAINNPSCSTPCIRLNANTLKVNYALTFTVTSIYNPQVVSSPAINIVYYDSLNRQIQSCQPTLQTLIPSTLTGVTFTLNGFLNFTTVVQTQPTDTLEITFPTQYDLSKATKALVYLGTQSLPLIKPIILSGNTIIIPPFSTTTPNPYGISISQIDTPLTNATLSPLSLQLKRAGLLYSSALCCSTQYPIPQTATLSYTSSTNLVASSANYTFQIQTTLPNFTSLTLTFCPTLTLTLTPTYPCYLSLVPSPLNCQSTSPNSLSISFPNSSLTAPLLHQPSFTITVLGIINPTSLSCSVSLVTFNTGAMQTSPTIPLTFAAAKMPKATLSTSSHVVNAAATYLFTLTNLNQISQGRVHLWAPPQITLLCISPTCLLDTTVLSCTCINSTYIVITLPTITYPPSSLSTHSLSLLSITNPISTKQTNSFTLALQSQGAVMQMINLGLTTTMTTLSSFNLTINYTSLTLSLPFTIPPSSTAFLQLTLPTQINCTSCTNGFSLPLPTPLLTSTPYTILITLTKAFDTITLPAVNATLHIDSYPAAFTSALLPTATPSSFPFTLILNHTYLGQPLTIWLIINASTTNIQHISITIPFPLHNPSLIAQSGVQVLTTSLTTNTLNASINALASTMAFTLTNISTPITPSSATWTINLYSNVSLLATNTSSIAFTPICGTICRDCLNTSHCLSCYNDPLVNPLPYLSQNTCLAACPPTSTVINLICEPCLPPCASCSLLPSNCTACSLHFLLSFQCVPSCPKGYYPNTNACLPCPTNCLLCTNSTTCTQCLPPLLQSNLLCTPSCPNGYTNVSYTCIPCPTNCLLCTNSTCTSCTYPHLLPLCTPLCPAQLYPNGTHCITCQPPCQTCSTTSSTCTSCLPTYSLSSTLCLPTCPPTQYQPTLLPNLCLPCPTPCQLCLSPFNCTLCTTPYLLDPNTAQCLTTCTTTQVPVANQCINCITPCSQCTTTPTTCLSCIPTLFLDGTTCVPTCTFPKLGLNATCLTCYPNCLTCSPGLPYQCTSCTPPLHLQRDICVAECPPTTFLRTDACLPCSTPCYNCTNTPTQCSSCTYGLYLKNTTCVSQCSPLQYAYDKQCLLCNVSCATCQPHSPFLCASCPTPLYYNPFTLSCTLTCPNPYFNTISNELPMVNYTCIKCSDECLTCLTATTCSTCPQSKVLVNERCLAFCPQGHYAPNNTCIVCPHPNCALCDAYGCLSCIQTHSFLLGDCYDPCPASAPYVVANNCTVCLTPHCLICDQNQVCQNCLPPYLLLDINCVTACPMHYIPDALTNKFCIVDSPYAYQRYLSTFEKFKTYPLLFSTSLLTITLILLLTCQLNILTTLFLTTSLQSLSFFRLVLTHSLEVGPLWLMPTLLSVYILCNCLYTLKTKSILLSDQQFAKWVQRGKNKARALLLLCLSVFNCFLFWLMFSGLFATLFTSAQVQSKSIFKRLRVGTVLHLVFATVPITCLAVLVMLQRDTLGNNIFFAGVDVAVTSLATWLLSFFVLALTHKIELPKVYHAFIQPKISNVSLAADSAQRDESFQIEEPKEVEKCMSTMGDAEHIDVGDFKSVFDPEDYQQPQKVPFHELELAIKSGYFRKGKKVPREKRRNKKLSWLRPIAEEEEVGSSKKQNKRENVSHFIYWKPPKEKKVKRQKYKDRLIMERIQEKQSQFDSITQGDIVFLDSEEQPENQQNDLNQYDTFLNINYASRKHLGEKH